MDKRSEFISDVLTSAVEGGIGYWAEADEVVRDRSNPYIPVTMILGLRDHQDDVLVGDVTTDTVERGIALMRDPEFRVAKYIRDAIIVADNMSDASEVDAEIADVIVQAGVFGKLIYG